ncbi:hypothetical protein BGW36DRAFT_389806 [Talaromyces proteolyticus]|uniref:Zn(2)-C6 fungal-type domain-containing protein n=1 Tax=Talaromyces proteolyticus TaxID=1131652 RepID=A0AAD4KFB4_9EURO|nr:uncharacterized protein BGW36DRAFT_389806 [Talaromyces proteolyticus]KAH8689828.1 hypothetical protein BGW36DRAFT_389806 [Talaromyces proteolyticus]
MSRPSPKRFACDRCRDQKLRCPRDEKSSDACARCLRAGAVCVTGCTRLIGRPPRATTNTTTPSAVTSTATVTTASTSTSASNSSLSPTLKYPALLHHRSMSASSATSRQHLESVSTRRRRDPRSTRTSARPVLLNDHHGDRNALPSVSPIIQKPFQQSSGSDDIFRLPLIEEGPNQPIWLKSPSSNLPDSGLVQGDFPQPTTLDGVPPLLTSGAHAQSAAVPRLTSTLPAAEDTLDRFHDLYTADQFLSQDLDQYPDFAGSQLPELPDGCDAVLWLANLNGSISRQLAQVSTRPCIDPCNMAPGQTAIFSDLYEPSPGAAETNPLGELLYCTFNFLNILRAMDATPSPSSSSSSASLKSPSLEPLELMNGLTNGRPSSPMGGFQPHWTSSRTVPSNTPTILMIITTYLQLVRLYDAAVARIYASLLEMPEREVASFQALPGLRLGGFPLLHGNLHIKIILQVLEHQLILIERVMGLPAEYRLSTQQETAEGIFRNSELLVLLRAVMGQKASSCDSTGLHYVVSFKDNLQKVQQLLQG